MSTMATKRIAVIGASGIGKHHAHWWMREKAQVCAFVGTTSESVERTRAMLLETFGIETTGYTSIPAMLEAEHPEIVDVCSPAACHYEHVQQALEAGCDVFCEKPFVYDEALPHDEMLEQAEALVALANRQGVELGVCTQYAVGAHLIEAIRREKHGDEPIVEYHGHLESPAKGRPPDPVRAWVDLGPHPISVIQVLAPDGTVEWDSVQTRFDGYEAIAEFQVTRPEAPAIDCTIVTRRATEPPWNTRHFKINGSDFRVEGGKDPEGVYCARIETADGDHLRDDMVRLMVREFLRSAPVADGPFAVANLELLLRFIELARGGNG